MLLDFSRGIFIIHPFWILSYERFHHSHSILSILLPLFPFQVMSQDHQIQFICVTKAFSLACNECKKWINFIQFLECKMLLSNVIKLWNGMRYQQVYSQRFFKLISSLKSPQGLSRSQVNLRDSSNLMCIKNLSQRVEVKLKSKLTLNQFFIHIFWCSTMALVHYWFFHWHYCKFMLFMHGTCLSAIIAPFVV